MPKTTMQILQDARAFLEDEDNWIKGLLYDEGSGSCCALGAVTRAYDPILLKDFHYPMEIGPAAEFAEDLLDLSAEELSPKYGYRYVDTAAGFNDHSSTTHGQVLEMFDRAIELAEAAA
jgi:hypothetical protein